MDFNIWIAPEQERTRRTRIIEILRRRVLRIG